MHARAFSLLSFLFCVQHSAPYALTYITTFLYILAFNLIGIHLSFNSPPTYLHPLISTSSMMHSVLNILFAPLFHIWLSTSTCKFLYISSRHPFCSDANRTRFVSFFQYYRLYDNPGKSAQGTFYEIFIMPPSHEWDFPTGMMGYKYQKDHRLQPSNLQ